MERAKRSILIALLLSCCSGSALGADERIPTKFIQQVLSLSHRDWFQALYEGRTAIDNSFFDLCEARIEHSLKIQEIGDAWEFALLCNRATEVLGSRGKYRTHVVRACRHRKASSSPDAGRNGEYIAREHRGQSLNALLLETEGRFSEAYSSFLEAAEAGFEATDCGIRMAKLRRLIAQDCRNLRPNLSCLRLFLAKNFQGGLRHRDSVARTLCREGDLFRSRGEFVKAQGAYEKALSQDPLLPEGNVSLGILLL